MHGWLGVLTINMGDTTTWSTICHWNVSEGKYKFQVKNHRMVPAEEQFSNVNIVKYLSAGN